MLPSVTMKVWRRLRLEFPTLIVMAKGASAPTIAIAIYQAKGVQEAYTTLGYVIATISVLSFCIMPRAKFIQTVILSVVGTCIAAAMALLVVYCSTQARNHTEKSAIPEPIDSYNSSASAVSAIWLFFNSWLSSTIRVAYPNLNTAAILYIIFLVVTSTWGPQFATMESGIAFVVRLLKAFLTGLGLATGVNLILFPISSRDIFFRDATAYLESIESALSAHLSYVESLGMAKIAAKAQSDSMKAKMRSSKASISPPNILGICGAETLHQAVKNLTAIQLRFAAESKFAKREITYGYLDAKDMDDLSNHLRMIYRHVLGMSTIVELVENITRKRGLDNSEEPGFDVRYDFEETPIHELENEKEKWKENMQSIMHSCRTLTAAMIEGLAHVTLILRLGAVHVQNKEHRSRSDLEKSSGKVEPGSSGFFESLEAKMKECFEEQGASLQHLYQANNPTQHRETLSNFHSPQHKAIFLAIYIERLRHCTADAVLDFVRFADAKAAAGTLKKRRWLLPGSLRTRRWLFSVFKSDQASQLDDPLQSAIQRSQYPQSKDPGHLPPSNAWEKIGDRTIRNIPRLMRSTSATFGFRVACALLTVAIPDFLHDSQTFFIHQRGLWAETTVAISMSGTAGLSLFGYLFRLIGTISGAAASLVIYYIPNGHDAGVIVFFWILVFLEYYIIIKFPRFAISALLAITTEIVIVGYSLQVRKIGINAATASGQIYLPIYKLAPYRLAVICVGLASAFIWTIFPYPITSRARLCEDLSTALFTLAKYSSSVHATVSSRLRAPDAETKGKLSHELVLDKKRERFLGDLFRLLQKLREDSAYAAWEPTIGGKFPRLQYNLILDQMQSLTLYLTLISDGTHSLIEHLESRPSWIDKVSLEKSSPRASPLEVTNTLVILAACLNGGQPVPASLASVVSNKNDQYYSRSVEIDKDMREIPPLDPGYSAFIVMQIASRLVDKELRSLIMSVKSLVGEIDFLSSSSSSIDGDGSGTTQFWDSATQQTSRTKNE